MKTFKERGTLLTFYCVRHPKKKAVVWCGHVIFENTKIKVLAGWCHDKCLGRKGFVGWIKK
jgi:hypothetical protein